MLERIGPRAAHAQRAGKPCAPIAPRQSTARRVLAGLLGVVLAGPMVSTGHGADAPTPAAESPRAPARAVAALQDLREWVKSRGGRVGVHAVEVSSGKTLLAEEPALPLNPASNMKVITAAAALDMLGPHFSYQTALYGELSGPRLERLVLRGHGDPSLTEASLWRLASSLSRQGVEEVATLFVDQSQFDAEFTPPGFEQQPEEWAAFRAPVSAVALARNTVTLNVLPGAAGEPARSWFEPDGIVTKSGEIKTERAGRGQAVQWQLTSEGERLNAKLGGHLAVNLPRQRFTRRLDDPRLAPGLNLAALLRGLGVSVGEVKLGGSDVKTRITFTGSAPLSELIRELGKASDNFYAEMLFKSLSIASGTHPKTSAGGAKAVEDWLRAHGHWREGTRIVNGSGLFDTNRTSAELLTGVLKSAYDSPRSRSEFVAHLAIGGVDGTLRSRFKRQQESRAIRAKTGTLNDVISLSGYVLRRGNASPIAFAIIVNGIPNAHAAVRGRVDAVVEALAEP